MITTLVILLIGFAILIITAVASTNINKIKKSGIEADGVIFSVEHTDIPTMQFGYPIVRFLTNKNEWITESSKVGLPMFYTKEKKVTVIYIPDKPTQFVIKTKANNVVLMIIALTGVILLVFGVLRLFGI